MQQQREEISLETATTYILEECRMVLPGIQALFGFQLIAVFNESFGDRSRAPSSRKARLRPWRSLSRC